MLMLGDIAPQTEGNSPSSNILLNCTNSDSQLSIVIGGTHCDLKKTYDRLLKKKADLEEKMKVVNMSIEEVSQRLEIVSNKGRGETEGGILVHDLLDWDGFHIEKTHVSGDMDQSNKEKKKREIESDVGGSGNKESSKSTKEVREENPRDQYFKDFEQEDNKLVKRRDEEKELRNKFKNNFRSESQIHLKEELDQGRTQTKISRPKMADVGTQTDFQIYDRKESRIMKLNSQSFEKVIESREVLKPSSPPFRNITLFSVPAEKERSKSENKESEIPAKYSDHLIIIGSEHEIKDCNVKKESKIMRQKTTKKPKISTRNSIGGDVAPRSQVIQDQNSKRDFLIHHTPSKNKIESSNRTRFGRTQEGFDEYFNLSSRITRTESNNRNASFENSNFLKRKLNPVSNKEIFYQQSPSLNNQTMTPSKQSSSPENQSPSYFISPTSKPRSRLENQHQHHRPNTQNFNLSLYQNPQHSAQMTNRPNRISLSKHPRISLQDLPPKPAQYI